MAHLLRIVMIHGHLEGVVELSVDAPTKSRQVSGGPDPIIGDLKHRTLCPILL